MAWAAMGWAVEVGGDDVNGVPPLHSATKRSTKAVAYRLARAVCWSRLFMVHGAQNTRHTRADDTEFLPGRAEPGLFAA